LTPGDDCIDNRRCFVDPASMDILALLIEIAAIVTPIVGIVVELRRDIPDDDDRGLRRPTHARLPLRRSLS
jgi:hypothetical protein